jgi:hypothetical protein
MIQVRIRQGTLMVRFASWARLFSRVSAVSVPADGIQEVHHLDRPLAAATGWRSGLLVSGVMKDRRTGYDELILSVRDAEGIRRALAAVIV